MDRPLVVVTGPTATGKTSLAVELAEHLERAEILSVDSRQVFRYLDIGTAKPTPEQRARVPHHLLDLVDPDRRYSAGEYAHRARALIRQLWGADGVPLLVGGSGLYLQAVLDGLFPEDPGDDGAGARRARLRQRVETDGVRALHAELGLLDPVARVRIGETDAPRILRALEVAGGPARRVRHADQPLECLPLAFCLHCDRQVLYRRIDARVDAMLAAGLVAETEALRRRGYGAHCPALGPMGYGELLSYLDGRCSLEEARCLVQQRSRRYAKRQLTWFRHDRRLRWLDLDAWGREGCLERMLLQIRRTWPGLCPAG